LTKKCLNLRRGGPRGTPSTCVGEQKSNYGLKNTKLKAIFDLLHRCSTYLKSVSAEEELKEKMQFLPELFIVLCVLITLSSNIANPTK